MRYNERNYEFREKNVHFTTGQARVFGGRQNAFGTHKNRAIRKKRGGGSVRNQFRAPILGGILLPHCRREGANGNFAASGQEPF